MKKIIFLIGLIVVLAIAAGIIIYAKDAPVFDLFFSKEKQEERELNRMAKLYPKTIGDYSIYNWSAEKIQKNPEKCEEINETLNRETGNIEIQGTVCGRFTIGQYRQTGTNNVVFVHLYEMTSGKKVLESLFLNMLEKQDKYNIIRPEPHEIGWLTGDNQKIDYIITQEATVKLELDGGQSMSYFNKATGNNSVTKYFISKYPPTN